MKKHSIILALCMFGATAIGQQTLNKEDYRDPFIGNYQAIIYYWADSYPGNPIYDTTETIITVEKFLGYVAGNDSNFIDIEHKIGIIFGPYAQNHDDSWCAWTNYYTHGYLHPTIDSNGILTYPELEDCLSGYLSGFCDGDSINVEYGNGRQMSIFNYKIKGEGINTIIEVKENQDMDLACSPNPFTSSTTLSYTLSELSTVTISIFNPQGQLIEKIEQEQPKGEQQVQWNAEGLPAGMYYFRIQAGEMVGGGKMVLLR